MNDEKKQMLSTRQKPKVNFSDPQTLHAGVKTAVLRDTDFAGFDHLLCFKPWISEHIGQVLQQGPANSKATQAAVLIRHSLPCLLKQLNQMALPTLCLEVNVARIRQTLRGHTPQQRLRSFSQQLHQTDQWHEFATEYPVLIKRISHALADWQRNTLRFWHRLEKDLPVLEATFGPQLGQFDGFEGQTGDSHQGGQKVLICRFTSGTRVVYKPRSLSIDQAYQQLCQALNKRLPHSVFKPIRVIDQHSHGWAEHVPFKPCEDLPQVRKYYHRVGHHLALLDALKATDFHHENVVIHGSYPVLVDLETLTQTDLSVFHGVPFENRQHQDSLLNTGILPDHIQLDQDHSLDISLLGASEQPYPYRAIELAHKGTDQMQLRPAIRRGQLSACQPRITGQSQAIKHHHHVAEVIKGYTAFYRFMLTHRDWFTDTVTRLLMTGHTYRCVMRPTQQYMKLLATASHPDLMRCDEAFGQHLNRLHNGDFNSPAWQQIQHLEQLELAQGDVPMFHFRPDSPDLTAACGTVIKQAMHETPLAKWLEHIKTFTPERMQHKLWLIKASFSCHHLNEQEPESTWLKAYAHINSTPHKAGLLQHINDHLMALHQPGEQLSWPDVHEHLNNWKIKPAGCDLYDGLPGTSLYLHHCQSEVDLGPLTELAGQLHQQLSSRLQQPKTLDKAGAFTGTAGALYWLSHTTESPCKASDSLHFELLSQLSAQLADCSHDVIDGLAGCLLVLCHLYPTSPDPRVQSVAATCAQQLISTQVPAPGGCGWSLPGLQPTPVTGLAHGGIGVALALARYSQTFGDESVLSTVGEALAFEMQVFNRHQRRWLDHRTGASHRHADAWCTGSVGAGIAALKLASLFPDLAAKWQLPVFIQQATHTALHKINTLSNDSLCHGTAGMLHLLHEVSLQQPQVLSRSVYRDLKHTVIRRMQQHGIRCGLPQSGLTLPGLMRGVCGVGLELLRQRNPQHTPNVLILS